MAINEKQIPKNLFSTRITFLTTKEINKEPLERFFLYIVSRKKPKYKISKQRIFFLRS